jgi:ribosome-associated protein
MYEKNAVLTPLLQAIEEMHAIDVTVIDVSAQTTVTDFMVICGGRSSRHVKAIAQLALERMKAQGFNALSDNGVNSGDWALVDFGDVVLHVMQAEIRAFYNLEGLWQNF